MLHYHQNQFTIQFMFPVYQNHKSHTIALSLMASCLTPYGGGLFSHSLKPTVVSLNCLHRTFAPSPMLKFATLRIRTPPYSVPIRLYRLLALYGISPQRVCFPAIRLCVWSYSIAHQFPRLKFIKNQKPSFFKCSPALSGF